METVTLSVSTGFTTHWIMPHMVEIKRALPLLELRFQLIMSAISGPVTDVDLGMRFIDGADERHRSATQSESEPGLMESRTGAVR